MPHLGEVSKKALGDESSETKPHFGDSVIRTFFYSNEKNIWNMHQKIEQEDEVKDHEKAVNCRGSAIEACVTKNGTNRRSVDELNSSF